MYCVSPRAALLTRATAAAAGPVYDALATDWAARVVTNGGSDPSAATKQAVSDFCAALRSANILSKMKAVCLLTPGGLVEALTPVIKTEGGLTPSEKITNGGFTSSTTGWTVNYGTSVAGGQSGNCLQVRNTVNGDQHGKAYQAITTVAGRIYKLTFYFKKGTAASGRVSVGTTAMGTEISTATYTDAAWALKTVYFTATGTTTYISLGNTDTTTDAITSFFDTVSVIEPVLCNDPWTNVNFVSGDLTVNGLVGNGSSKYLNSGFVSQNCLSLTSAGITVYLHTTNASNQTDFSACSSGTINLYQILQYGGATYWDCWNTGAGRATVAGTFTGYMSGNRTAANASNIYRASSGYSHASIASTALTGGALLAEANYAFAQNNAGAAVGYSSRRMSFMAAHDGLASAESSNFYAAIQALRTALGGGYV